MALFYTYFFIYYVPVNKRNINNFILNGNIATLKSYLLKMSTGKSFTTRYLMTLPSIPRKVDGSN